MRQAGGLEDNIATHKPLNYMGTGLYTHNQNMPLLRDWWGVMAVLPANSLKGGQELDFDGSCGSPPAEDIL